MGDAPEKKRRKLTTALKDAIGVYSQKPEENTEKPIALALISDNKSAQDLLDKIQASRRPQAILEVALKICREKKSEAHIEEAFLSIFRKHFSILGIDSAIACWKLIQDNLNESGSLSEILIATEFINSSNLLGHGFGKLLQEIKSGLPLAIQKSWNEHRRADSLALAYALISLVLAENAYGDNNSKSEDVFEYWKKSVLVEKSMKKDYGMMMISSLTGDESFQKSLSSENEIPEDELQLLSKIYTNHLEFFSNTLHQSNCVQLLSKSIQSGLQSNQLMSLSNRLTTSEVQITSVIYQAVAVAFRCFFEATNADIVSIDDFESLKMKELAKYLSTISEIKSRRNVSSRNAKKLADFLDFIISVADKSYDSNYLAALSILVLNIAMVFEDERGWNVGREILKDVPMNALERLVKGAKGLDNQIEKALKSVKKSADEKHAPKKFVNRTAPEVIEKLESSDLSVDESIELLEGVHVAETKKEVFDAVVKFVEELPGGEHLNEMKLFKLLIEMYGGSPLESLALQVVFSRIVADGWTDFDRTPGTEKSDESWFAVLVEMIDFLDVAMKSAKNSIIKSYTALYCQLYSQVLKNSQKFVRNSLNAVASRTLSVEIERGFILRRHKLSQDVSRLVDGMKRNESYFSMLAASIIGDAVFYGSDSLLAMSKLHSLADKNASGLLATNLPAVERTRYKKFLSTITRASKRVY
ncbi:Protein CBG05202 [Caenorhabditis briggsae]|uniref:Protein CBG05202 n=2 Tax=Caenorhabditis briggsae TaxID=6238 RepID=A8WZD5_CAEBR|nr:Protein CBG05202 [Caenorhabditis briggsae]ULT99722.1 hypothetical protein L3Y34_000778 [Caenorhabditis briggsae]CAP25745.1 Protein CBG05202 [Caenorhabditis briggsae]